MKKEEKKLTRGQKNKLRHKRQVDYNYNHRTETCPNCGGQMTWCSLCQTMSMTCCEDYGSCMCS